MEIKIDGSRLNFAMACAQPPETYISDGLLFVDEYILDFEGLRGKEP